MYIILTQCFPSRVGGIESLVSNLALSLGKKNKVIVFADRHNIINDAIYDNKYKDIILIRRFAGLKFFRRRKKIKELKTFIESTQVKLVLADTWKSLELVVDYLNVKKIPVACLAHGNELLSDKASKLKRITNTLEKVTTIIPNSNYTTNLIKNIIQDKGQIKFVYPGAEDLRVVQSDKFMQISGEPVLITLSRLEKRKGHIKILEALKKLRQKFPEIKYLIAGEGIEKSNLKKIIKKSDLDKNVNFTGILTDKQKKYLYENSDLMVMPTLDESNNRSIEGFGIAYLEAAFFGVPSIASNIGGTPEAVLHEKTGLIVNDEADFSSVLYNLLSNKEKLNLLGSNAKKRAVEEFTWEIVSKKYLSLINN